MHFEVVRKVENKNDFGKGRIHDQYLNPRHAESSSSVFLKASNYPSI